MNQHAHCHYHSEQAATWRCSRCDIDYGDCCVPTPPPDHKEPAKCARCRHRLEALGASNQVAPFASQWWFFLTYPASLASCLVLAVVSLLLARLPADPIPRYALLFVLASVWVKYGYHIVYSISQGRLQTPELKTAFTGSGFQLLFKQLLILGFVALGVYSTHEMASMTLAWVAAALLLFLLPASIMVLACEHALLHALSPDALIAIVKGLGLRHYLFLYLVMAALVGAYAMQLQLDTRLLNHFLVDSSLTFATGYGLMVLCAMMGYSLFEHQASLGYAADFVERKPTLTPEDYEKRLLEAEIEIMRQDGRLPHAIQLVRGRIADDEYNFPMHRLYQRLLREQGDNERLGKHAKAFIRLLLDKKAYGDAARVYADASRHLDNFNLHDPQHRHWVAQGLMEQKRYRDVIRVLRNLHLEAPTYAAVADAYLLAARAFAEGLGQDDQARRVLALIGKLFPHSNAADEARKYAEMLGRL